jgi:hypothetical protein
MAQPTSLTPVADTTWKALVDKRLKVLGTHVFSLVSDQAKTLIQLVEQGLECFSMPDFSHLVHEIVKSYFLVLGQSAPAVC